MTEDGKAKVSSDNKLKDVSLAAGALVGYACSVSSRHIRNGRLRLQFNREVAYYMRSIIKDVEEGRRTAEEGIKAIRTEQASLTNQSTTAALQGLGIAAGGFQVAGGIAMCVGTAGGACSIGVLTIAHGANNIYENGRNLLTGRSDTEGPVRRSYQHMAKLMGQNASSGNIAYGTFDIGLSVYGLYRKIPGPNAWRLFRYLESDLIHAYKSTKPWVIGIDVSADAVTGHGVVNEISKE